MPETSPDSSETTVARLLTDAASARKIIDAIAESFAGGEVVASAFEEPDGRWSVAVHFQRRSEQASLRALVAAAAGAASADALIFDALAPADWVRKGLEGLEPVAAGRFTVHGAHDAAQVQVNRIRIQIEAALAFGTGHHGSTRGCLLALDRIASSKGAAPSATAPAPATRSSTFSTSAPAPAFSPWRRRKPCAGRSSRATSMRVPSASARDNAQINGVAHYVEVVHAAELGAHRFANAHRSS